MAIGITTPQLPAVTTPLNPTDLMMVWQEGRLHQVSALNLINSLSPYTLSGLGDVDNALSPNNGDILRYNSGTTQWETAVPGAGSGDMTVATYDPAGVVEQLVGLTAAQTLTNKTLTNPLGIIASDIGNTPAGGIAATDVQAALNELDGDKQNSNAGLTDIAGLSTANGNFIVGNGANWVVESLGTARTSLGLAIGTDVQAYNAALSDIAGLTFAQGDVLYYDGANLTNLGPGTSGDFLQTQGAGMDPIWATPAGSQNVFSSIAVAAQPSITADSPTEVLTLEEGTGVTLLTNNVTKKVTISTTVVAGASPSRFDIESFVGTGQAFVTLATTPASQSAVFVFYDSALQQDSEYTLAGNVITFNTAVPANVGVIEVRIINGGGLQRTVVNVGALPDTIGDDEYTTNVTVTGTIDLPPSPADGQMHRVRKDIAGGTLTIDGNGNNINGSVSVSLNAQYTTLNLQFNATTSEWMII